MTAINLKVGKLLEMFKGLKSDAVPRPPRPTEERGTPEEQNVNVDRTDEQEEEIVIESVPEDDIKKEKKSKKKFFKSKNVDDGDEFTQSSKDKHGGASSVNVQGKSLALNSICITPCRYYVITYYYDSLAVECLPSMKQGLSSKPAPRDFEMN